MLAVAQLLILPGIFRKLSLHLVTLLFAIVMGLCAAYGLYGFAGSAGSYGKRLRKSIPEISPWMWIAAGVILVQIGVCVYYAHMDADDAFYVATATTSVHTDSIFAYNPYSGVEYAVLPRRYVLSPFPVLLAVISQLSGGLHPAVTAHTIYPVVFLLAAYLVYHQFGRTVVCGKKKRAGVVSAFLCCDHLVFRIFCIYGRQFHAGAYLAGKSSAGSSDFALPYLSWACSDAGRPAGISVASSGNGQSGGLSCFFYGDYAGSCCDRAVCTAGIGEEPFSSEISLWDFVLYAIPASGRCIFMSVSRVNPGNTKELLHATADKGEQTLWIM